MRTAKCNVCGQEWELINEAGLGRHGKLRLEGTYWKPDTTPRGTDTYVKADLCSLSCLMMWTRKELGSEAYCDVCKQWGSVHAHSNIGCLEER